MDVVEFVRSVNVVNSVLFVCAAELVVNLIVSVLLSADVVVGAAVVSAFGLGVVSAAMDLGVVVTSPDLGVVVLSGTFSLVNEGFVAAEDVAFELSFDGVSVVIATGVVSSSSVSFPFRPRKPPQQGLGLSGKQN